MLFFRILTFEAAASNAKRALVTTWLSGASQYGAEVANGQFASWRGEPTPIATTWSDATVNDQIYQWPLEMGYKNWTGDLDLAVGAIYSGESWAAAASGAYDARYIPLFYNTFL